MKKLSIILICMLASIMANASDTSTGNDKVYLQSLKAIRKGTTSATLNVNVIADTKDLGAFEIVLTLPNGISLNGSKYSDFGTNCLTYTPNYNGNSQCAYLNFTGSTAIGEDHVQATIPLTISTDIEPGNYDITLERWAVAWSDGSKEYVSNESSQTTLTVKRSTDINYVVPETYGLEIIPFKAEEGENQIDILYKAPTAVKDLEFDITLPKGMFFYNKSIQSTLPEVVGGQTSTAPSTTIELVDEQSAHVKISGSAAKTAITGSTPQTGMLATNGLIKAFSMTTYVFNDAEVTKYSSFGNYSYEKNSIQEIVLSDISLSDYSGTICSNKEYKASVFFGKPTETTPIVYGHYTEEALKTLQGVSTNFTSVDMTSATIDEEESAIAQNNLPSILVWGPQYTSYYRHMEGTGRYGTICMPFELSSDGVTNYYKLSSANADKNTLTFTQVSSIPANKPALYLSTANSNISLSKEGYKYSTHPGTQTTGNNDGLTFTGTYSDLTVNDGDGYYLSTNQFYSKGQNKTFHIAPYHAYIAGTIQSTNGAKGLTILIDDETGIHDVTDQISEETMNAIYDLQGIKQNTVRKGAVNIINGKKVLVK